MQSVEMYTANARAPYYRPVQVMILSVIDRDLGREPANFRAVNLALGALTAALFAVLVGLLFGDAVLAGIAGAVVAAHPAGIENYVWIAGMTAALAAMFGTLSLLSTLLAMRASAAIPRVAWALASLASFLLALGSKESAAITPALTLALMVSHFAFGRKSERHVDALDLTRSRQTGAAILLIQVVQSLVYLAWWRPMVLGGVLTGAPLVGGGLLTHTLTVLASWPGQFLWALFPISSSTSDVVPLVTGLREPRFWIGLSLALSAPLVWIALLRARQPVLALGWAWMWLAFLPGSGIAPLLHVRAERYIAPSVFGLALFWAWGACALTWRLPNLESDRTRRIAAATLGALVVMGLGVQTWDRVPAWKDDITLFERDVRHDPRYREGYVTLAKVLAADERWDEAKLWLDRLAIVNADFDAHWSFVDQLAALGLICEANVQLGAGAESLSYFGHSLRPDAPELSRLRGLYRCGARSLEQAGRVEEALEIYHALRKLPGWDRHPLLMADIARCHALAGRASHAAGWLKRVPRNGKFRAEIDEVQSILESSRESSAGSD
jgi:tetratricopeptide (TPR) repeat protein